MSCKGQRTENVLRAVTVDANLLNMEQVELNHGSDRKVSHGSIMRFE